MKASGWICLALTLLTIAGCADPVETQLAALRQQHVQREQASRARNEAFARMLRDHHQAFLKRLDEIQRLPLEEREAALNRLKRDQDAWDRDVDAELEREGRELDREEALNAQRDLTDAINDLSNEIEDARSGY
jgi:hypothetical protein